MHASFSFDLSCDTPSLNLRFGVRYSPLACRRFNRPIVTYHRPICVLCVLDSGAGDCLPCIEPGCPSAELDGDAEYCNVCWTESLLAAPCVKVGLLLLLLALPLLLLPSDKVHQLQCRSLITVPRTKKVRRNETKGNLCTKSDSPLYLLSGFVFVVLLFDRIACKLACSCSLFREVLRV